MPYRSLSTDGPRPPLPKLAPGDEVIVIESPYRSSSEHRAKVTKVARVWIDLEEIGDRPCHWRMRVDTQNESTARRGGCRFSTPEQHEWDQRLADAYKRIRAHGVVVEFHSPWHAPERRMLLADLLDQHKEDQ